MAFENEQDQQGTAGDTDTGSEELADALGEQDGTFVTEQKKSLSTGTLVMAGLLLACGVGTYVMYTRSAASKAAPTAESSAAQTTITQFLSDDKANVNKMKDLLDNTEKAVAQFRASPGKAQVPVEDLQTNPFRIATAEVTEPVETTDKFEAAKRELEAKAATMKAAQALSLQFVMSGRKKSCMINNAMYVEGQTVGEFSVESISANAVVIRKDDARFELKMKK
jgi:hypothetical protein